MSYVIAIIKKKKKKIPEEHSRIYEELQGYNTLYGINDASIQLGTG